LLSDKRSIFAIIGCLLKKPFLLDDTSTYKLTKDDFNEQFHKIIFAAISNLYHEGIIDIDYLIIDNYLSNYNLQYDIFINNNGIEYLQRAVEAANLENFNYAYNRVKKFSLLRELVNKGVNIKNIYDDEITDPKQQEVMQEKFDELSLQDITDYFDKIFIDIKSQFLINQGHQGIHAGEGIIELKEQLKNTPEIGLPLRGNIMNMATRGARLKKLFMRSMPTAVGKTRLAIADACNIATDEIWSEDKQKWIQNGFKTPTLFMTTELEMDEIQTLLLAFLSNVDESHILDGNYKSQEEEKRVDYAAKVLKDSALYIEYLPNFCYTDVENIIRKYYFEHKVKYHFFDYIHTTVRMLSELMKDTKGMRLREDNILHMFSTNLKELCNELGIFIYTATQVSGEWESKKTGNQNILRGAKALADKLDIGYIGLFATAEDLDALSHIIEKGFELQERPNIVFHMYKNRRSKYGNVKIWSYVDLGTCRIKNLFVTDNSYNLIPVSTLEIEIAPTE